MIATWSMLAKRASSCHFIDGETEAPGREGASERPGLDPSAPSPAPCSFLFVPGDIQLELNGCPSETVSLGCTSCSLGKMVTPNPLFFP